MLWIPELTKISQEQNCKTGWGKDFVGLLTTGVPDPERARVGAWGCNQHSPSRCPLQKPCSVSFSAILVSAPRIVSTTSCNPVTFPCKMLQELQQWSASRTPQQQPWADAVKPNPLVPSLIPSSFWAASYRTTQRALRTPPSCPCSCVFGDLESESLQDKVWTANTISLLQCLNRGWGEIWAVQFLGAVQKQLPHWCCCM